MFRNVFNMHSLPDTLLSLILRPQRRGFLWQGLDRVCTRGGWCPRTAWLCRRGCPASCRPCSLLGADGLTNQGWASWWEKSHQPQAKGGGFNNAFPPNHLPPTSPGEEEVKTCMCSLLILNCTFVSLELFPSWEGFLPCGPTVGGN